MKKIIIVIVILIYTNLLFAGELTTNKELKSKKIEKYPFYVYRDGGSKLNNYFATGKMGAYGCFKFDEQYINNPYSGKNCIKIDHNPRGIGASAWAGLYWQYPAKNWGNYSDGYNLSKAKKLTFWARGENGGEKIERFIVGGLTGEYPDSDKADIGPTKLTKKWQKYTIDLRSKNLAHIIGGFAWIIGNDSIEPVTFYLDEIAYQE